jgi:hypothetical protein
VDAEVSSAITERVACALGASLPLIAVGGFVLASVVHEWMHLRFSEDMRRFLEKLGFKVGRDIASKVYIKKDKMERRVWVEVYKLPYAHNVVFALSTDDDSEVKEFVETVNSILEDFARMKRYERAV